MSCLSQTFPNDDGIPVEAFIFYCDGCGKVVRGKMWRGRHRVGINAPPAGWTETMGGDHGEGVRIAWCSPECEEAVYNMEPMERQAMFNAASGRIKSALLKCGRRILGLQPWEQAPWEEEPGT